MACGPAGPATSQTCLRGAQTAHRSQVAWLWKVAYCSGLGARARAQGILVLAIYNQLISVTQGHCHFARAGLHSRASPPARHPAAHVRGVSRSQLPALTHWPLVTQRARCEHSRELPVL